MQQNSQSGNSAPGDVCGISESTSTVPQTQTDPVSSFAFDWSEYLDFNLDENVSISFPQHEQRGVDQNQPAENPGRVRKRDPRLACSNFLEGRIPCACPELDGILEEEETELTVKGKKRARAAKVSPGGPVRCQVVGCEADISQLKGYHKRHRVCLRCANANAVMLGGVNKRYCQQCGKFHILSDFDEGKRSCRRKLERHNRRRRKANDAKGGVEKEAQQIILTGDVSGDDEARQDGTCVSSQIEELEVLPESDGRVSTPCSAPGSQSFQSSIASFSAPGEIQNSKYRCSSSFCNKSTFSSACPSDRISFKLYNWNPAEFPRRLRHQIFHWLANMPVELEEYIRPGCTILTAFISMPKPMWCKLLEEPARYIRDLIASPGSMLFGRGTMLVYLNGRVFYVTEDAASIVRVNVKNRAPKLHFVYPTCFEAGRPMEFVACGSDLLQPNFRFLISFSGKYLEYNISVSSICCEKGDSKSFDHQLLKIFVPRTKLNHFGPAFIEVENQSGLSNFIPILVGDKGSCNEMETLQQKFGTPLSSSEQFSHLGPACEVFASRQSQFSEFILDVAWSLKKPASDQELTSSHVQSFNQLLNFLIEKESSVILERVFCSVKSKLKNSNIACISDADARLLRKNMDIAHSILNRKLLEKDILVMPASDETFHTKSFQSGSRFVIPAINQSMQISLTNNHGAWEVSPSLYDFESAPLLKREVVMNSNLQKMPGKLHRPKLTNLVTSRPLIMAMAVIGVCFGVCSAILHPRGVQIAATAGFCLFDYS